MEFMIEHYDDFKEAMANLEPTDFVKAYINIIKYVVPTLQSVSMESTQKPHRTIEDTLLKLAEENEK